MRAAAAKASRKRLPYGGVGGPRVPVEVGFGSHDDAIDAEAALHGLRIDESLLDRMGLLWCAESFECRDLRVADGVDRSHARANRFALDHHRTRPALPEPAAELRPAQPKVVAENKEERCVGIDIHPVTLPVDAKRENCHLSNPIRTRASRCRRCPDRCSRTPERACRRRSSIPPGQTRRLALALR